MHPLFYISMVAAGVPSAGARSVAQAAYTFALAGYKKSAEFPRGFSPFLWHR